MIPALAFNGTKIGDIENVKLLGDHLAATVPVLKDVSATQKNEKFHCRSSALAINGLILNTSSHNGLYVDRENHGNLDLTIPIEGYINVNIDKISYHMNRGELALISSSERRKSVSMGSSVILRLDRQKFNITQSAMNAREFNHRIVECPLLLPMKKKNISFFGLFQALFNQISLSNGDSKLLEMLAIDDRFYRLSVGLTYPEVLLSDESMSRRDFDVGAKINTLCEFIYANLKRPISLTEMEQFSRLSVRTLNIVFNKKFGMGARQWIKKQRLCAARQALLDSQENTSIAFVAYDFCFPSSSEFSRHYQQEFGELPEQTIKRES